MVTHCIYVSQPCKISAERQTNISHFSLIWNFTLHWNQLIDSLCISVHICSFLSQHQFLQVFLSIPFLFCLFFFQLDYFWYSLQHGHKNTRICKTKKGFQFPFKDFFHTSGKHPWKQSSHALSFWTAALKQKRSSANIVVSACKPSPML